MKFIDACTKTIKFSFYSLFLFVPLLFSGSTSELFELNKMWVTYGITIVIGFAWFTKMILQKKIAIQRTPLDIPLMLFFLSQIISTVISLDSHVSFWGYYSRFNGGLLSTITYILLYYAFVSNFATMASVVRKLLFLSLLSGTMVMLWGLPSHFGYDPTCFVFRGSFDTSCWTEAFKPTIRAFSTLGQPAWFAAYLAFLLPLAMVFALKNPELEQHTSKQAPQQKYHKSTLGNLTGKFWLYFSLTTLFFLCLIFADTRAGFIGFVVADIFLWGALFLKKLFTQKIFLKYLIVFHSMLLIGSFFFGTPIINLKDKLTPKPQAPTPAAPASTQGETQQSGETVQPGGIKITDSGTIRLNVWRGAIDAWKAHPLFGTGVETFAFAYYPYKPAEHNLTSEWDYLYNKAHNEYLNYLTTTGIFGLGSYLSIIALFLFITIKYLWKNDHAPFDNLLIMALVAGYISILISNFFGFSIVIINLFFFMTPALVFILGSMINTEKTVGFVLGSDQKASHHVNPYQWTGIIILGLIAGYLVLGLFRYWYADTAYALGSNFNRVGSYQEAYPQLLEAANAMPNEPVYQDEFALNLGALATALLLQKDATNGAQFAHNAIALSDQVVTQHPNNIVYWKNRVRLFYTLAQGDPEKQNEYYGKAFEAINKAYELSPNDAKVVYNLAVLYDQVGQRDKAIETITKTIALKPDYRDAYYALGLFYHEKGDQKKAIETYTYILKNIAPNDPETKKTLSEWEKEK
jgi:tetratricopeptide (TPR) repeat protein